MPPFLPRKRLRSDSPDAGPSNPSRAQAKDQAATTVLRKPSLFHDLDAGTGSKRTAEHRKALLDKLAATDDEESSLSSLCDEEFEDVPSAKRQKTQEPSDDEEDEDIEFEDVHTHTAPAPVGPAPSGDLELTLRKDTRVSLTNPLGTKKGPSKIERGIRVATHQMHVQLLMWHNAIRNSWLCDKELQEILISHLSPNGLQEVEKWRRNSGLHPKYEDTPRAKGKGKTKDTKGKKTNPRSQRDWGQAAERLASGQVNMSSSDPLYKLLEFLRSFWKRRFRIVAPGLRKLGYMSLERLDAEIKSFNNEEHDPESHGELIRDVEDLKKCAKNMEGSRDVGAQLFTALLRGLGLEARMVANLQPVGFGWSQAEEALEKNPRKPKKKKKKKKQEVNTFEDDSSEDEEDGEKELPDPKPVKRGKAKAQAHPKKEPSADKKHGQRSLRNNGLQDTPIELATSEDDDESIIDVTPVRPRTQQSLPYDKDLLFPHYWTEVLSPVSNTYTAVDANVIHLIATNSELLERFEPRGAKAEKAKQVTSYIVGHSSDGTAKDVTTRYLKRHVWPGRTKGNRLPVEKIPIYNHNGKVKRYEEYDWFKVVMSGYVRGTKKCPRTDIDDHEEATILKPVKPVKKEVEEGKETLQSYKASTEFVLERHLRREEALIPGATHVKMFTIKGKGEDTIEEKVFRRADVVSCKSMETWHKEGRAPIAGEEPLKRVPYRAATTNRRRELAEAEQASGGKVLQGLYSRDQTDWIIPPPIENGIIPKNSFGNIDLYVESMLPDGAVHIPRRSTMKICKRLGIDYAEAVTGFEFGHRMAVPIITGVVVAVENYEAVMEEWEKDEAERVRKEDEKRTRTAIGMWRKMLMGLRIIKRVREEYGDQIDQDPDILNPWTNHNKKAKNSEADAENQARIMTQRDEEMGGGFFPEGYDEEEAEGHNSSSFFPILHEDDNEHGGGFIIEDHEEKHTLPTTGRAYATPQSLQRTKMKQASEEDQELKESNSESEAPPPRKRGRPMGSANKGSKPESNDSAPKAKTLAQHTARMKVLASQSYGKRKSYVADSGEDEGEDVTSSLSELKSELASEVETVPENLTKVAGRRATMPAKTLTRRQTPRRNAARRSASALRSHYFEHDNEEDDDG